MDKLLITQDDLKEVRPAAEFDEVRIEPFIREAQRTNVRPVLNDALYLELIDRFDDPDVQYNKYRDLIQGKRYTKDGYTILFDGLKWMLSYYVLVLLVTDNPLNFVRFGVVKKIVNQSEPLTPQEMTLAINSLKSTALIYQNNLIRFLEDNSDDYPLYNYKKSSQSAVKTSFSFGKL